MEEIRKVYYKTVDGAEFDSKENALVWENDFYKQENNQYKKENTSLKQKISTLQEIQDKTNKTDTLKLIPEVPGVYLLTNPYDNFKHYIGSAINLRNRYLNFLNEENNYAGDKIKKARQKTKPHLWLYTILEICNIEELETKENFYITAFKSNEFGYNKGLAKRRDGLNETTLQTIESKQLQTKIYSNYATFQNGVRERTSTRTLDNNDVKVYSFNIEYEVDKNELWYKKEQALQLNNGNQVIINRYLMTLDKDLENHVITINDIVYLPAELGRCLSRRQKYIKSTGLKTGVIYNSLDHTYTAHIVSSRENIDDYIRLYETEDEAFNTVMDCKRKEIIRYTEKYKDNIPKEIYNKLMNLTIEEVEKLICY